MLKKAAKLLSRPARFFRSRGFGIHSPFAYSFVRDVIHCPYDYYAYPQIHQIAHSHGVDFRRLTLIFRVANSQDCRNARCFGSSSPAVMETLRLLRSDFVAAPADSTPDLVVATANSDSGALLPASIAAIASGGAVILFGNRRRDTPLSTIWTRILDSSAAGMSFADSSVAIFVGKSHLPRQDFEIRI